MRALHCKCLWILNFMRKQQWLHCKVQSLLLCSRGELQRPITKWVCASALMLMTPVLGPKPQREEKIHVWLFYVFKFITLQPFWWSHDRGHMSACAIWSRSFAYLSATLTSRFPQWNVTITVVIFHYYWSLNSRVLGFHSCLTVKLASMVSEKLVEVYLIIQSNSLEVN